MKGYTPAQKAGIHNGIHTTVQLMNDPSGYVSRIYLHPKRGQGSVIPLCCHTGPYPGAILRGKFGGCHTKVSFRHPPGTSIITKRGRPRVTQ
jgi:hypothetical protein